MTNETNLMAAALMKGMESPAPAPRTVSLVMGAFGVRIWWMDENDPRTLPDGCTVHRYVLIPESDAVTEFEMRTENERIKAKSLSWRRLRNLVDNWDITGPDGLRDDIGNCMPNGRCLSDLIDAIHEHFYAMRG